MTPGGAFWQAVRPALGQAYDSLMPKDGFPADTRPLSTIQRERKRIFERPLMKQVSPQKLVPIFWK